MLREALADAACPKDWYHAEAIKFYKEKGSKFWRRNNKLGLRSQLRNQT